MRSRKSRSRPIGRGCRPPCRRQAPGCEHRKAAWSQDRALSRAPTKKRVAPILLGTPRSATIRQEVVPHRLLQVPPYARSLDLPAKRLYHVPHPVRTAESARLTRTSPGCETKSMRADEKLRRPPLPADLYASALSIDRGGRKGTRDHDREIFGGLGLGRVPRWRGRPARASSCAAPHRSTRRTTSPYSLFPNRNPGPSSARSSHSFPDCTTTTAPCGPL